MIKLARIIFDGLLFFLPAHTREMIRFEIVSLIGRMFSSPLKIDPSSHRYVNLGCGDRILKGFVNIDFFTSPDIDYAADLRFPLRIGDKLFDGIFTEHTLEHLSYVECLNIMGECHRILKPGGVLRIVVPDLSIFIHNYCLENQDWFLCWEKLMLTESTDTERAKRRLGTPMEAISFVTQEYGHVSSWDYDTLSCYLNKAGFSKIKRQQFQDGTCTELLVDLDSEDRKLVSLYVEAVK